MERAEMIKQIKERLDNYQDDMINFMRDMIRIPSESCQEREVVQRIKEEMEQLGFDEIRIDPMGNILGRVGSGDRVIAYDAHIDTVGVGNPDEWDWDPFAGKFEDGIIYGRGATDQEAAMVSMLYAGKVIKDLNLHQEFSLYFVGSIQEEDCDGLCWQYIINEDDLEPEMVVVTEPTNLNIYRGHRGRMEMEVTTEGVSCHGSAPHRGENSLYKIAPIISGIERLNKILKKDDFLGKGTITVTHIYNDTPSLCAVPNKSTIHLDRRLTAGEDKELALQQVEEVIEEVGVDAKVEILNYDTPSYTGLVYETEKYYPTWVLEEDHDYIQGAVSAYRDLFDEEPTVDKWTFSTNGVSIMGRCGIPCIGFGPANEIYAHTVNDQVPVDHLLKAAKFYALYPDSI
ncbi:M20/DapE family protein YgeY/putative selenium metabolism hydrolase [Halobacteroides halobius DSM 5150]|uniref:M20/DapE family protein YgeY/putative selenium metabolism hydrolase n=1 Tax=Halobacteroides halobius (strain ATCC 35273 / DSM 5150 / MD-1) TaxID=748449 RepID=L0K6V6_HALHC|nr:YgeY family selenium metabolism-linked hydrolase [Halobacteroides halobius]AGB41002.1 M20/DapE family protein YgeY/putative selenium metabolism hydrolase [Halobacteroides halobius DSM 5150]